MTPGRNTQVMPGTTDERAHRRRDDREVGPIGLLGGAITVWAGLIVALFAVVYFSVANREPEVLAFRDVNIELTDFDIAPDLIEVAPSTALTFIVSNSGDAQHNLQISEDVATPRLKTGESAILEAGVARESYVVWCSVKGHRELGMEARVNVRND